MKVAGISAYPFKSAHAWCSFQRDASSAAGKLLWAYGGLMALAWVLAYVWSLSDPRTIRDVGTWSKPMKFMAATALFAWTTVCLAQIASDTVSRGEPFKWIVTLGVVVGLVLTFVLSTISGFQLGGNQPPPGEGLPVTGWHLRGDVRPARFLGVHAQQFIPLLGLLAVRALGGQANLGLMAASSLYVMAWAALTVVGLRA